MSLITISGVFARICFPRVSGDEPVSVATTTIMKTFSPRERG